MKENIYPCDSCKRKHCARKRCEGWRKQYMGRQELINGYAQKYGIKPVYIELKEDPCTTCSIRYTCEEGEEICPARAKWWDVCMEELRGRLGL